MVTKQETPTAMMPAIASRTPPEPRRSRTSLRSSAGEPHQVISSGGIGAAVGRVLDDPARAEPDQPVGHPGDRLVVGDDQDRLAEPAADVPEQGEHRLARLVVEGPGRLVAEQQLRVLGQGPGDRHPLLLAAGELRGEVVGPSAEADQPEALVDVDRVARPISAATCTFSLAVRVGTRLKNWKTKPTASRR